MANSLHAIPVVLSPSGLLASTRISSAENRPGRSSRLLAGIATWTVAGDLIVEDGDTVIGLGAHGASILVGNNVSISSGASFDFSAIGAVSGAGGSGGLPTGIGGAAIGPGGQGSGGGGGQQGAAVPSYPTPAKFDPSGTGIGSAVVVALGCRDSCALKPETAG